MLYNCCYFCHCLGLCALQGCSGHCIQYSNLHVVRLETPKPCDFHSFTIFFVNFHSIVIHCFLYFLSALGLWIAQNFIIQYRFTLAHMSAIAGDWKTHQNGCSTYFNHKSSFVHLRNEDTGATSHVLFI